MTWQDVGDTLKKIGAPFLSGLVAGGPVGAAAATAISLLSNKIGTDKPEEIISKLTGDNSTTVQNVLELEKLLLQRSQIDANEMSNARSREEEMAKIATASGQIIDRTPRQIAIMFTIGFITCNAVSMIARFFYPELNFDTALQTLNNGEMFILGYYYGSSNKVRKV